MDDLDTAKIEELVSKIKNDDYIKVDRELINVDTFSKINSSMKPQKMYDFESKAEEINRILDKLNDGMYMCDERPEILKTEDKSDLSTIINEQRYSVNYNTVFQQNDYKENFIVCKEDRLDAILLQLKINVNENVNNSEDTDKVDFKDIVKRYDTIQEAINNASPGQSIIIDDGTYRESISIDKTIELKALNVTDKKEQKKVEIIAESGDCITLRANCGHIEGLKILCDTPGNTFCAKTISGLLEIDNCYLSSDSAGCFYVEENAKITIKDSELYTSYTSSSLKPESHAIIMDCRFTQPSISDKKKYLHPAISIDSKSTCIIIDCTIESMVDFKPYSKGMLLRCHISTKGRFIKGEGIGVYVRAGAEPLIKNCKIDNCQEAGIRFDPKSKGVVDDCIISDNDNFGVLAFSTEQFLINNSHIENNKEYGLRIKDNSKGEIVSTEIKANIKSGVLIENGCDVKMKKCQITDHKYMKTPNYRPSGISIKECQEKKKLITKFSLIDSTVSNNISGITISGNSDTFISKTSIVYNNQFGIAVERDSKVEINECDVSGNGIFQLTSPIFPLNFNPENQTQPSANAIPSSAEITVKSTNFGPYGLHCIVLSGKSISNFNSKCTFANSILDSLKTRKITSDFDVEVSNMQIGFYDELIKKEPAKYSDLPQKKKILESKVSQYPKFLNRLDDIIKDVSKVDVAKSASSQDILISRYQFMKVSPFIITEGNARCSIDNCDFKSNISFIDAREASKLSVTNTEFFNDCLQSIRLKNNVSLDLIDSNFKSVKTGILIAGNISANILRSKFSNSQECSIKCGKDGANGWKLNMEKSQIILGNKEMINLTGKGEAKFIENKFYGQNINDGNSAHRSSSADTALSLSGVSNCFIEKNVFRYFKGSAVNATQSTVKINGNEIDEVRQFPLFFTNSNIEITNNNITNTTAAPQSAIRIQNECTGSIVGNSYKSSSSKFLEVTGKASNVRDSDNNVYQT